MMAPSSSIRTSYILKRSMVWLAALALVAWILTQLPFSNLRETISGIRVSQWFSWILLNVAIIALLVGRWLVLTRAMGLPCRFVELFKIRQAGQLVSFVTPGPQFGGEPLQVFWLWRKYGVSGHNAFLAVGLDRFFELSINFAVLLLAVLALLSTRLSNLVDWEIIALILLSLLCALGVLGWLMLRRPLVIRDSIQRLTNRWRGSDRLSHLDVHVENLTDSLQRAFIGKRSALGFALVLSTLAWVGMIAELYLLLTFVGVPVDTETLLLLFTVVRLAFLLPLPGGVGSVEAGLLWAFQAMALPLTAATGLIVMMRLRDVMILLTGAAALPGLQASDENSNED